MGLTDGSVTSSYDFEPVKYEVTAFGLLFDPKMLNKFLLLAQWASCYSSPIPSRREALTHTTRSWRPRSYWAARPHLRDDVVSISPPLHGLAPLNRWEPTAGKRTTAVEGHTSLYSKWRHTDANLESFILKWHQCPVLYWATIVVRCIPDAAVGQKHWAIVKDLSIKNYIFFDMTPCDSLRTDFS
jgi:hypothetical protein